MENHGTVDDRIVAIRRSLRSYRAVQVYITFAELGIGDALATGSLSINELAGICQCNLPALRRFLSAAEALGLVVTLNDGRVANSELATEAFTSDGSTPMANLLRLESAFYRRWAYLPEAVRSGKRPEFSRQQERDAGWVHRFTRALFDASRATAIGVTKALAHLIPEPDFPTRVIDVGGGHGGYSIALAEQYPGVRAIVFDLPAVIEVTNEIVVGAGMTDRVTPVAGDFHVDPLGENFDIALLFGVLHGELPENVPRLLTTVHDALRPGGTLLIRVQGRRDSSPEVGERELTDLHMLLSTDGGSARSTIDTEALLRAAGFDLESSLTIPSPGSGSLVVATRPG